jgi:hypothetical protein
MEPGGMIVKRVTLQMFHLSTRDRRLARDPSLVRVVRRRIAVGGGGGLGGGAARPLKPTQTDPESRVFRSGTARPQHLPCQSVTVLPRPCSGALQMPCHTAAAANHPAGLHDIPLLCSIPLSLFLRQSNLD